jgi:regulator of protease activity HflC (stomatin/prohibitin superfamily)
MINRAIATVVILIVLAVGMMAAVKTVPAGHVGIMDLFGKVRDETLPPGLHLVNPLIKVHRMSVQTRESKEVMDTPSSEGLIVHLEVSVLFHLDPAKAVEVYKTIGTGYDEVLVEPNIRSAVREVTSAYQAKALYSAERDKMGAEINRYIVKALEPRGIQVETVLLRAVQLPPKLQAAIQEKLSAEQEAARMEFMIARERQEAERKKIEAEGIAAFQRIVSEGISEPLLRWKGIEATLKLAESPNSKVVIIGAGKEGLPVILGGDTMTAPASPARR